MEEKNELNDIILNRGGASSGNKKIILAVATLGVILIIVVMLMNTLSSGGTDNLPQAVLPPEPQKQTSTVAEDPLFEEVAVVQEAGQNDASLDQITQKLKEESTKENTTQAVAEESVKPAEKEAPVQPKSEPLKESKKITAKETKKIVVKETPKEPQSVATKTSSNGYYIQVGSFEKNQPDKKFLDSILNLGYKYKFHEVAINSRTISKVLVGPFDSETEARKALKPVRSSVEAGAFLTKI